MKKIIYFSVLFILLSGCYVSDNFEFGDSRVGKAVETICGNYKISKVVWIYKNGTQKTAQCTNSKLDLYYSEKDLENAYFKLNWNIESYTLNNVIIKKNDKSFMPSKYTLPINDTASTFTLIVDNIFDMPNFIIENINNINWNLPDALKITKSNSKELLISGPTINQDTFQIYVSRL